MYIRPQLSRKRTGNREILLKEHIADTDRYRQLYTIGKDYESDIEKIKIFIATISQHGNVSDDDKNTILFQLNCILKELQKEYDLQVGGEFIDIENSMQERIDEIESVTKLQESETFRIESAMWSTNTVDKDKLIAEAIKLLRNYQALLVKSKSELRQLMKESVEQRQKIKKHRIKR